MNQSVYVSALFSICFLSFQCYENWNTAIGIGYLRLAVIRYDVWWTAWFSLVFLNHVVEYCFSIGSQISCIERTSLWIIFHFFWLARFLTLNNCFCGLSSDFCVFFSCYFMFGYRFLFVFRLILILLNLFLCSIFPISSTSRMLNHIWKLSFIISNAISSKPMKHVKCSLCPYRSSAIECVNITNFNWITLKTSNVVSMQPVVTLIIRSLICNVSNS